MNMQTHLETKLTQALNPEHLEIINESYMHHVPEGSESHFKVIIVSHSFEGKMAVKRHQLIYQLLSEELQQSVHALALHTYTLQEWQETQQQAPSSPNCAGQGKHH
ncbi:DNA-binding transcriptional regulator BolA [invertebrate metagenome]|uniref:DNA-binding transcriptional regulator BolA n=1 Tax=invertebrate metagenome TaxID=1711999 RepID=A0A2H9T3R5_9ZZZZ